jgi:hypothetical protein
MLWRREGAFGSDAEIRLPTYRAIPTTLQDQTVKTIGMLVNAMRISPKLMVGGQCLVFNSDL